ncbi:unknown [Clostridium sp. CAG:492]|nr:unknown [Clostridium sp. CAG:492]
MKLSEISKLAQYKGSRGFFITAYNECMKVIENMSQEVLDTVFREIEEDQQGADLMGFSFAKQGDALVSYWDSSYRGMECDVLSVPTQVDLRRFWISIRTDGSEEVSFWTSFDPNCAENEWYKELRRTERLISIFGKNFISNDTDEDKVVAFTVSRKWFEK